MAALVVLQRIQVKVPVVGVEAFPVFVELWEEKKKKKKKKRRKRRRSEVLWRRRRRKKRWISESRSSGTKFHHFCRRNWKTCTFVTDTDMTLEDLEQLIQDEMCLPKGCFFLNLSGKMLDANRMSSLARDASVRVNFRLQGGTMRVPRDSPGQWTCDYCGITRCWATRSTYCRCGEARGHTGELKRHYRNVAREARENGTSNTSAPVASACASPPWAAKAPPHRSVPPRASSDAAPWATSKPLSEVDKIHDSDQTALLRAALVLFENCNLPPGVLDEIRKIVPPRRPPPRKQPTVSREQIVLNMKKRVGKEEHELRERKTALELTRKIAEDKQQKVLEQATVVSDLTMQLVDLRQDIEDATPQAAPPVPPPAPPPGAPPENTPLDLAGDDMGGDLFE